MYRLYIANKNYSSWSLRGWLCMKLAGAPFEEILVPFASTGSNPAFRDLTVDSHTTGARCAATECSGATGNCQLTSDT